MTTQASDFDSIIFDYGGVILNIDLQRSADAFSRLGFQQSYRPDQSPPPSELFMMLEKGLISPAGFYQTIRDISGWNISDEDLENAWNALILDMPPSRIRLLEKLKIKYRIFLLSNTNEIHYRNYVSQLKEVFGYNSFNDLFEQVFLSFEMGLIKPGREIFDTVIQKARLVPSRTLFIDDSHKNIETARAAGLQAFWLQPGLEITGCFDPESLEFKPE